MALNYVKCCQLMMNILDLMEWQVLHNIAVAEYYSNGCTDPQKLLEVLDNVKVSSWDFYFSFSFQNKG